MAEIEKFFDKNTMSVHIKEGLAIYAKKGRPGAWSFEEVRKKPVEHEEIKAWIEEITGACSFEDCFIELERPGSSIIQMYNYRIVVTKPPFSEKYEITAVRPVKRMKFEDYKLSEKLIARISEKAEGILIAGAPGHGKTTFAGALAEFYYNKGRIVKTVEAPRDLVLPDGITQYAISHGSPEEVHDVLLLTRPDYTIFDEMRNRPDFELFADLRLAGIGMAGVIHATQAVDAIQRFVGKIELGVIPHVIDTVIFIKDGVVNKVLSLQMIVKVPSGMTEADLARPVVVVNDFDSGKLEYEIYSYGEETVVIPVTGRAVESPVKKLAAASVTEFFNKYGSNRVEVLSDTRCRVYVPKALIAKIIGKQGEVISEIEKKLGISIDVQELKGGGSDIDYDYEIGKKHLKFYVDFSAVGKQVDVIVGGDYLLTASVGRKGVIRVSKDNKIGKIIVKALNSGEEVKLVLAK